MVGYNRARKRSPSLQQFTHNVVFTRYRNEHAAAYPLLFVFESLGSRGHRRSVGSALTQVFTPLVPWSVSGVVIPHTRLVRLFNVFTVHTSRCISVGALVVARLRDTTVAVVAHFMGSLCLLAS
jgi:hypothetical protein